MISNAVVGAASYGTYISLCEKVANKRQRPRPVVISPPSLSSLSTPRVLPLSASVCRKQPLAVRVNSDSAAMRYAGALLLTRNAHFNPAQSDSGTVIDVGRQLLCHHYDCVVAHRQQQQQQAQAATASSDRLTLAD